MEKRIYLSPPHLGNYEQQFVTDAFETNWIAPLGPHVEAFEHELAQQVRIGGALALSSGTAALHLALRLLDVGPGDSVFCSSLTFIGSANPILYQGAEPVFIDAEPETWNMSPEALKRAFLYAEHAEKLPKAVIVVNLYGQSSDMDALRKICNEYDVPIIEDAAESLGATYKNKASGTLGDFGVYSFNGNKIITTSGGGMLVSNNLEALEKARFWATQARDPALHYEHSEMGYNYRLSNVLAAIGRGQLKVLDERVKSCRLIFYRYVRALSEIDGVNFMPEAPYGMSNRWLTTLTVDPRRCGVSAADLIHALAEKNIESRPVWKPMHLQPLFHGVRYYPHSAAESVSDRLFHQGICLPSGTNLSKEEQCHIIECIKQCLGC